MFDSILVYLTLMFIMIIFTWCGGYAKRYKLFWAALASLSFAVIMGIRYNVGTDFPTYLNVYEQTLLGSHPIELERWEYAFRTLMSLFAKGGFHYSIPFGIIAFLQIFLVFLALRNLPKVWVFIAITLMLSCIWISYDNIMRHMLAFSIFVLSINFLARCQYIKYLICVLLAFMFHNSAVILICFMLPYYFRYEIFSNILIELGLFIFAIMLMNINMVQEVFENLSSIISLVGYESYMTTSFANFNDQASIGLGMLILIMISFILIVNSNRVKLYFENRGISIMYDIYFIGVLIRFAFARMFLMQRMNYYMYSFEFIIGALTLAYFYYNKKYCWFIGLLGLYFILFIGKMNQATEIDAAYKTFLSR